MHHKYDKLFFAFLIGLCTQPAFSATDFKSTSNPYTLLPCPFAFVASLSGAVLWDNAGQSQTLTLAPDIVKNYKADNDTRWEAGGEIFLGIQVPLPKSLRGQLGLAFAIANDATLSGDILDDSNQQFDNYNYRYQINHRHYALKGKLLGDLGCDLFPWISAGVGVGYNSAHSFTNTPSISEAVRSPNFSGNTIRAFTYSVGAGFQYAINKSKSWQVGLGYEFSDWGKSKLGRARGQTQGAGLTMNHLYTNAILANITYIG